jgi:hypothetical protein
MLAILARTGYKCDVGESTHKEVHHVKLLRRQGVFYASCVHIFGSSLWPLFKLQSLPLAVHRAEPSDILLFRLYNIVEGTSCDGLFLPSESYSTLIKTTQLRVLATHIPCQHVLGVTTRVEM